MAAPRSGRPRSGPSGLADYPGDVALYYTVTDESGTWAQSPEPHKVLHIKPKINITAPAWEAKFTFNDAPSGVLDISAHATAQPQTLEDQIQWSIWNIAGSNLTTVPDPPQGPDVRFIYTDLPAANAQFGVKYVKASLPAYNVAESVLVKVFFLKIASNHPATPSFQPNWYYYWSRSGAAIGPSVYEGPYCIPNATGYFYWEGYSWAEEYYHLCNKAGFSVTFNGRLYDGIDCFGVSSMHENEHYSNWWLSWCPTCPYDPETDDPDHDYIPSFRESTIYGTNPKLSHTFNGMWDQEYIGYWASRFWEIGSKDSVDWAKPGHQYPPPR